jgi:type IV fimbrial biogenesis protein FimT
MLKGCAGRRALPPARGFTVLELVVTVTLLGILLVAALPSFGGWTRNAKARSAAEALQNGMRTAQAEAVRRNRQVVFSLTADQPSLTAAAAANGSNWVIRTVAVPGEDPIFVQGGSLGATTAGVGITGPASVCFSSLGRQVANATPGASGIAGNAAVSAGTCTPPAAGTPTAYDFALASAVNGIDRRYRVTVTLGGQVRLCDRDRSLSTSPDGCA